MVLIVYPDGPPVEDEKSGGKKKPFFAGIKAWFAACVKRIYIKWRDRHIIH